MVLSARVEDRSFAIAYSLSSEWRAVCGSPD